MVTASSSQHYCKINDIIYKVLCTWLSSQRTIFSCFYYDAENSAGQTYNKQMIMLFTYHYFKRPTIVLMMLIKLLNIAQKSIYYLISLVSFLAMLKAPERPYSYPTEIHAGPHHIQSPFQASAKSFGSTVLN